MISQSKRPVLFVLAAAALFGSAAPVAKVLLAGISPVTLASLIYLGSGGGMAVYRLASHISGCVPTQPPLTRQAVPWLIGASLFGAVLATTCLVVSLRYISAWEASVLLSFEAVATTLVARIFFGEYAGYRVWAALVCITVACMTLAWEPGQLFGISLGAVGILVTCLCWGVDTSFSRQISGRDPLAIVMYKGLFAGVVTFLIARLIGEPLPDSMPATASLILGLTGFGGLMTFCFLTALRDLGPARTGSFFGINPIFGIITGLILFWEYPGIMFFPAVILMLVGIVILVTEHHSHRHSHPPVVHDHRHLHADGHHVHLHPAGTLPPDQNGYHSHLHSHAELEHDHQHTPDLHHQHQHRKGSSP